MSHSNTSLTLKKVHLVLWLYFLVKSKQVFTFSLFFFCSEKSNVPTFYSNTNLICTHSILMTFNFTFHISYSIPFHRLIKLPKKLILIVLNFCIVCIQFHFCLQTILMILNSRNSDWNFIWLEVSNQNSWGCKKSFESKT